MTAMNSLTPSLYIAATATATVVAGAAAVYVERERRKKKTKKRSDKKSAKDANESPKPKRKSSKRSSSSADKTKRSSSRDKVKSRKSRDKINAKKDVDVDVDVDVDAPGTGTIQRRTKKSSDKIQNKKESFETKSHAKAPITDTPVRPEPKIAAKSNKKVVVLISSYGANLQTKTAQERAMTILKGLKISGDQLETIDGASPSNREKRNELFGLSGIRAKYPQFFVVDQNDKTAFLGNWEDFEAMNDMKCLKQSLNLT